MTGHGEKQDRDTKVKQETHQNKTRKQTDHDTSVCVLCCSREQQERADPPRTPKSDQSMTQPLLFKERNLSIDQRSGSVRF